MPIFWNTLAAALNLLLFVASVAEGSPGFAALHAVAASLAIALLVSLLLHERPA